MDTETSARVERERAAWDAVRVDQSFKDRFPAVFQNPHLRDCEASFYRRVEAYAANATVLDYGCFDGQSSAGLLGFGPRAVVGIDVSPAAIALARARFDDRRLSFLAADAHRLPFADRSFDLVVGRAILHHLHLDIAYREVARVLKPGGHAMFVEPLGANPGARLVAWLTPEARTPDERPLRPRDIRLGDSIFGVGDHRFSGFFTAPLGVVGALVAIRSGSAPMRWASTGDRWIERTPLKGYGRQVYLCFERRGLSAR